MDHTHRPALTVDDMRFYSRMAAGRAKEFRRTFEEFSGDLHREARLRVHECATCYYLAGKIVGHAFTRWRCGLCGTEEMHHHTGTPRLCEPCALEHRLCRSCGGDIEMDAQRRDFPSKASIVGQ